MKPVMLTQFGTTRPVVVNADLVCTVEDCHQPDRSLVTFAFAVADKPMQILVKGSVQEVLAQLQGG